MENVVNRNVVVLPLPSISAQAVSLSQEIAQKFPCSFTLNQGQYLPHLTLHQFAIPEKNLAHLAAALEAVATQQTSLTITLEGFSLFGNGGVFWDARKTPALFKLHQALVEIVQPLREQHIMEQHRAFLSGTVDIGTERRQSLAQWGNPLAMATFWPHITLTACHNLDDARAAQAQLAQRVVPVTFLFTAIHLTEVGPFGTCPGSLQEFPLLG